MTSYLARIQQEGRQECSRNNNDDDGANVGAEMLMPTPPLTHADANPDADADANTNVNANTVANSKAVASVNSDATPTLTLSPTLTLTLTSNATFCCRRFETGLGASRRRQGRIHSWATVGYPCTGSTARGARMF